MTTPKDTGRKTQIVDVRGRSIVIRQLVDTQMFLLARWSRLLQRDDIEGDAKLELIDRMFTVLESVVVQEVDRAFLTDLMTAGDLDLRELISFVTAFNGEDAPAAPKVRRGRAVARR